MTHRWTDEEEYGIAEIRIRLKDLIAQQTPFPEVVGDRRILRFLRGKQMNVDDATNLYRDFLLWRKKFNVDQIRQEILYGGRHSPFFFPKGKTIIDLAPQIIVTPHSRDREGRPLCLEQYCFNPKEVLKVVSIEDYLHFLTYALEYRAMVMEQLSHEMEQQYLARFPNASDRVDAYGVVLLDYTIRDLKGVGFNHLGSDGRAILKAALDLGLPNYPEYLGKSHMINVPTLFSTMWYFLKQILDEPTQAKFEFTGQDFLTNLQRDISIENIPTCLGGDFELYNEPFDFDTSPTGPFFYSNAENDRKQFLRESPYVTFDFETGEEKSRDYILEKENIDSNQQSNSSNANNDDINSATSESKENQAPSLPNNIEKGTATSTTKTVTDATKLTTANTASNPITRVNNETTANNSKSYWVVRCFDFWIHFFVYAWQEHRLSLAVGVLATMAILWYEPVAFQALCLASVFLYAFFFQ